MSASRAHITFPKEVRADLDRLVDKRHRSKFVTDAVRKELLLVHQREVCVWWPAVGRIKITLS
jgi:metal-responsive CopG/Arc/MetJ family transcriptional regulator